MNDHVIWDQESWKRNCQNCFSRISSWKLDRHQNDLSIIEHISSFATLSLCDVFFRKSLLQIPIRNGKMSYWHCLAFRKWPIPGILLHDCQKLGVIAEVFPLEGAKVFNKIFFTILLNLSCNSHVDVGLIDTIQRFFSANSKQDIFYISCSDYATYRPIHCTALSLLMWNASGAIVASPSSGQPCRWASVL